MRIVVPPLRQRTGDVPLLIAHFLEGHERPPEVSERALQLLGSYGWPGNVRELENQVRRLCATGSRRVSANHLSEEVREGRGLSGSRACFAGLTLEQAEAEMVRGALEASGGNKSRAARQLGVPRSTLYHLLDRHGLG
jgi:DNA-binding NtrC family response regulator